MLTNASTEGDSITDLNLICRQLSQQLTLSVPVDAEVLDLQLLLAEEFLDLQTQQNHKLQFIRGYHKFWRNILDLGLDLVYILDLSLNPVYISGVGASDVSMYHFIGYL